MQKLHKRNRSHTNTCAHTAAQCVYVGTWTYSHTYTHTYWEREARMFACSSCVLCIVRCIFNGYIPVTCVNFVCLCLLDVQTDASSLCTTYTHKCTYKYANTCNCMCAKVKELFHFFMIFIALLLLVFLLFYDYYYYFLCAAIYSARCRSKLKIVCLVVCPGTGVCCNRCWIWHLMPSSIKLANLWRKREREENFEHQPDQKWTNSSVEIDFAKFGYLHRTEPVNDGFFIVMWMFQ